MYWLFLPALCFTSVLSVWDTHLSLVLLFLITGVVGSYYLAKGRWDSIAIPSPISSFLLLFGLWIVASTIWSAALFESWRAITIWFLLPVWAWILGSLDFKIIKKLLVGSFAILLVLCLIGFTELASGKALSDPDYRIVSLFSNPNVFASLIVLLLLPLQYIWLSKLELHNIRKISDWVFLVVILFVFSILVLTASRVSLICYAVGTLMFFWSLRDQKAQEWKRWAIFVAGLLVTYILMNYVVGDAVQRRFEYIAHPVSTSERLMVWSASWQSYLLQPFVGHGFGALHVPYAALRDYGDGTLGQYAHSDILQYLAELGPIGLLLSLGVAISFVCLSAQRLKAGFPNPNDRLWFWGVSVAILANVVASSVTYIFYLPSVLLVMALLLAGWSLLYWSDVDDTRPARRKRPLRAIVFGFVMVVAMFIHLSGYYVVKADQSIRHFSIEDHAKYANLGGIFSLWLNPQVKLEIIDVALSQLTLKSTPEGIRDVEAMIDDVVRVQPAIPSLWLQKARLEIVKNDIDQAEKDLARAMTLDPNYLQARLMLGRLLREQNKDNMIEAMYDDALRRKLTEQKYGVVTMDQMIARENNLPKLLPTSGKSR